MAQTYENRARNLSAAYAYANHPNMMANISFNAPLDDYTASVIRSASGKANQALREYRYSSNTINPQTGVQFNNPNPLPFDPTPEQIQECQNLVNQQYGSASSVAKSNAYRSCIARLPYKNIITQHVGQSGGVMLYTTIKSRQSNFNNIISSKDNQQARWVAQASASTGLSQIQILDVLAVSVMDQLGEEPETIDRELGPYMRNLSSFGAKSIVPGTPNPDIDLRLPKNNTQLKGGDLLTTIINLAITIVQFFINFKKRNDEARRRDQAFAQTPPVEENFIMKCYDLNGINVDCDEESATIKRCLEAISPIAIGLGLVGLWAISRS